MPDAVHQAAGGDDVERVLRFAVDEVAAAVDQLTVHGRRDGFVIARGGVEPETAVGFVVTAASLAGIENRGDLGEGGRGSQRRGWAGRNGAAGLPAIRRLHPGHGSGRRILLVRVGAIVNDVAGVRRHRNVGFWGVIRTGRAEEE